MAKKIESYPSKVEDIKSKEKDALLDFVELLRDVVDGDEDAIEQLRKMLDVWDLLGTQMFENIFKGNDWDDEDDDWDDDDEASGETDE